MDYLQDDAMDDSRINCQQGMLCVDSCKRVEGRDQSATMSSPTSRTGAELVIEPDETRSTPVSA